MAAILSPSAKQQFFTDAGLPAAGYRLFTYAANTTTPQATYANRAGTVANSNPIILNARGEATVYLTPGVMYDYQFVSQDGSQVWTQEDVSADAGDSNAVVFTQAGVGAIQRSSQDKMRELVSVKDFGATGDGTTDDTPFIQAAINAFAATGFGCLYFPRGVYRITSSLTISFNGKVYGDGIGASVIRLDTANQNGLVLAYSGYLAVRDLEFTAGVTKILGAGIRVEGLGGSAASQTLITNCRFQAQYIGIEMANAGYWTIKDCRFFEPVQFGIFVDNTQNYDAGDNLIMGNTLQKTALTSTSAGIQQVASGGTKVIGNKILGFDRGYALIPRVGALSVIDTQLVGNSIEDGNTGIFIQTANTGTAVGQMTITGNQMSNKTNGIVLIGAAAGISIGDNQIACNFASHIAVYMDSMNGSPSQVILADNQISGNSSAGSVGIYAGNLANVKLADNQISGCATPYANTTNTILRGFELPYSLLPGGGLAASNAGNGSYGYVIDGTTANPVAGGGTGCFARRLNGMWVGT